MKAYANQRSSAPSPSTSLISATNESSASQVIKREDLPASDNTTLTYGEHRPDDAALDRVAGHLNSEAVMRAKRSRARPEDGDAEVNYINDKNKHFNKKIARFYDKYTTEIRENCEWILMSRSISGDSTDPLLPPSPSSQSNEGQRECGLARKENVKLLTALSLSPLCSL